MPKAQAKRIRKRNGVTPSPTQSNQRNAKGQLLPGNTVGFSGQGGIDAARARKALNLATISEMHAAFREGGREAIRKVMKNAPAQFLKMLVLLVPRELEVTHSGGVKGMSDEQLERGIEALEAIMAKRAAARPGDDAKLVDASPLLPQPGGEADTPS